MRIALVAPVVERVPPVRYGGTERVVHNLAEGLIDHGHQVTLFAAGDAQTRAELVASVDQAVWHNLDFDGDPNWPLVAEMGRVAARQRDFDVIHNHADAVFFPLLLGLDVLALTTLHGRLDQPAYLDLLGQFRPAPLISISDAQRRGTEALDLNWVATVHHGLSPRRFTFQPEPRRHLVFLGRISPEKGPDIAIKVAIQAGLPLLIAAKVPDVNRDYFDNVIRPLLKSPGIEFLGEVNEREKDALLGDARALLFPADWPEPFGLALIEAMACGTPVVALRRGSIPEIVSDGLTGFVCDTPGEMPDAVARIGEIARRACRERFEAEFSVDSMVERYEAVYTRALAEQPLPRRGFQRRPPLRAVR
ncbi:MAG TPA: glycosyltransferase family 4 protein [Candidatus Dormibacteraeota bacterium]|nr:glycosyltransferase family 4 protein [Candidatus Dormibacteraeota bacterium]